MAHTSEPSSSAPNILSLLPNLSNLFGSREVAHAKVTSLKNTHYNLNPLYGNDANTLVVRFVLPSRSVIIKQHFRRDRFRIERCNYLFLNEISPDAVPRVLAMFDESGALVLEDLGDRTPADPTAETNCSFWKQAVKVIAGIHSVALRNMQSLQDLYNGCPPKHESRPVDWLLEGISRALRKGGLWTTKLNSSYLRELLFVIIRRLAWYRDTVSGFALSERSISNIRVIKNRVAFIDLVKPPIAIPHLDLISVWHSPYRDRLIQDYIDERQRLSPAFNGELFRLADYEFVILESLRWMAIRLGTLPNPAGMVAPVKDKYQLSFKIHRHCLRITEAIRKLKSLDPEVAALANRVLSFDNAARFQTQ